MFNVESQSLRLHKPPPTEEIIQEPLLSPAIIFATVSINIGPVSGMEGPVSGNEGLGSNPWETFR